jgi:hypothetical protein
MNQQASLYGDITTAAAHIVSVHIAEPIHSHMYKTVWLYSAYIEEQMNSIEEVLR